MKMRLALLPIVFLSAMVLGRTEDRARPKSVLRLEYIHFDTVNQSIQWEVSTGTINEDGDFMPSQNATATYLINLRTGQMKHAGQDAQMSLRDSDDASRVFQALALLMQSYTDRWDGSGDPDTPAAQEDSPQLPLYRIAAQCPMQDRLRATRSGDPVTAILIKKEVCIPQNPPARGAGPGITAGPTKRRLEVLRLETLGKKLHVELAAESASTRER